MAAIKTSILLAWDLIGRFVTEEFIVRSWRTGKTRPRNSSGLMALILPLRYDTTNIFLPASFFFDRVNGPSIWTRREKVVDLNCSVFIIVSIEDDFVVWKFFQWISNRSTKLEKSLEKLDIYIKMHDLIANERYRRILPSLYEYFRSSFR